MAGYIPQEVLDDILSKINIVEVISEYIPLKRAGRNYKALCPFHHEKTASFMVSPTRQIYHCFGCQAGGNAFNFLVQYERLEFPEAVESLAKKAGVVVPQVKRFTPEATHLITQLYKINELAASFYQNNLHSTAGLKACDYLLKRGIKEETIKLFKLGLATDKWDALINHFRAKNIGLSLIEKGGLIIPREGGGYYDRFRQRLVLPISDIKSRILGFGARALDNTLPKYINSPESAIYTKGRYLFGLHLAKEAIRENDLAVVVEGYMDFILPYQEGLQNIVASLGTALTQEQVRLLKRYTHHAVMLYDADVAGELATLRSLDIFIEEEMEVEVVSLPQGFDPDLYVRKNGVDKFKEKIASAETLFDYKLKVLKSRYDIKKIEEKVRICAEMLGTINKFKNAVLKSEYIKKLSGELKIEEAALLEEMRKIKEEKTTFLQSPLSAKTKSLSINPTEKLLIKLMLEETPLINRIRETLEPADFQDARVGSLIALIFELLEQGKEIKPNILMNRLGDTEILEMICESSLSCQTPEENKDKILEDCIQRLKEARLKTKRQQLHEEIKTAQHLGDEVRLKELLEEFHYLTKGKDGHGD